MICNYCTAPINQGEKYVSFKLPGTDGKFHGSYLAFHNRHSTDCWWWGFHKEQAQAERHPVWAKIIPTALAEIDSIKE